ncbi:MAG TPA: hypothetical protein PKC14_01395 [Candidatus Absconditabacterales bacterium]|nr:hypothetical protein [Candidatus Absconditabacterales bacterium]
MRTGNKIILTRASTGDLPDEVIKVEFNDGGDIIRMICSHPSGGGRHPIVATITNNNTNKLKLYRDGVLLEDGVLHELKKKLESLIPSIVSLGRRAISVA